jgi:hypothetical protein
MSYREFFNDLPRHGEFAGLIGLPGIHGGMLRVFGQGQDPPQGGSLPQPAPGTAKHRDGRKPDTKQTPAAGRDTGTDYIEDPRRPLTLRDLHQGWGRKH